MRICLVKLTPLVCTLKKTIAVVKNSKSCKKLVFLFIKNISRSLILFLDDIHVKSTMKIDIIKQL